MDQFHAQVHHFIIQLHLLCINFLQQQIICQVQSIGFKFLPTITVINVFLSVGQNPTLGHYLSQILEEKCKEYKIYWCTMAANLGALSHTTPK